MAVPPSTMLFDALRLQDVPQIGGQQPPPTALLQALQAQPQKRDLLGQQMALSRALLAKQGADYSTPGGAALGGIGDIFRTGGAALGQALGQQQQRDLDAEAQKGREAFNAQFNALQPGDVETQRRLGFGAINSGDEILSKTGASLLQDSQFQEQMGAKRGEAEAAGLKAKTDADAKAAEIGTNLRKEFLGIPAVRTAIEANIALDSLNRALKAGTAAGDMAGIFAYMKALDPNSSVREGEYANASNATGVPGQVLNLYNRALEGKLLNPDQRSDFMARAEELRQARMKPAAKLFSEYSGYVQRSGLEPREVLPDLGFNAPATKQEETMVKDGQKYVRLPNGKWGAVEE
jgi:hypothetical protein